MLVIETMVALVVMLAMLCNLLTLYLVLKQGFRKVDMWLAAVMTLSDALVVFYKIIEVIYVYGFGNPNPLFNFRFGQWHGAIIIFLLQMSTMCVGYLAFLRFWVIFLRNKVNPRSWCIGFILPQILILFLILMVASRDGFRLKENRLFYYPELKSRDAWVLTTRYILMLAHLMSVLPVNICYPCIAWRYLDDIHSFQDAGFRSRVEARALKIRKAKILLKIFIMILAYNLVMLPLLILLIYELAAKHTLSMVADNVVVFAMASLTFVNPLMLLILHHDTWRELKATISRLRGFFLKPEPNKMGFQLQCDASEVALTSVKPQLTSATNLH